MISELTGEEIDSASEAWRHETECRYVLDQLPDREARNAYLDAAQKRRGEEAVARIRTDVYRLIEVRKSRTSGQTQPGVDDVTSQES